MNINIKKSLTGLFILLAMNAWAAVDNREDYYPAPTQGEHSKRIYIAPDGKRYMARELPLYLYISSTPGGENVVPLAPKDLPPSSTQLSLPEGLQVFKRTDPAAAKESLPAPDRANDPGYEIYIDGTSPVTTATFPGAPIYEKDGKRYYGKGLTMELVSRDLLSGVRETYLSINGKPYAPWTGSFSDFPADSFVHLRYYAVDQVGNVEKPVETMFYLDVSPPNSELQVKGNYENSTLAPGSVLELSAEDALSGVKEIHYKWDDAPERVYTGGFAPTELSEGDHTLSYYAIDQTGNIEEIKTGRFFYDKTAPAVTVSIVEDQRDRGEREGIVFVSRAARAAMAAPDNHAGTAAIRYSVDAGEEQTYKEPFPLPLPAGIHRVTYRAVDKVGNWSEPQTWSVYLDITPPDTQYQISGYYAGSQTDIVLRKDAPVFLVATDLEAGVKEIRYNIDGGETSIYKDFLKFETDGRHTLTYWGVDGVNNREEEKKLELRVDNSLKGTGGHDSGRYPRQWYADPTGKLTGTVDIPFYLLLSTSDKDDGQWFLLDLPKLGADTGQAVMFKKGGISYLQLQAGGPGGRADMFQVRIDALPPLTRAVFSGAKIYESRDGIYFGPGLTAAVDARDAEDEPKGIVSGYRETYVSLDDSPFFTYKAPLSVFSREKAYRFRYFSVDNVGNAEEVKENKFTVDTTPPVTTWKVSGLTQGRILSPQSLIELSAVDNLTGVKEIYYRFDDGPEKKYGGPLGKAELGRLAMGEHILFYYAQDQTGNREKTGELSFYFDTAGHSLELKVTGDRHDKGVVVYISPRSRLGFTAGSAAGDQTPVKNIRYRFDGGAETPYENTSFPPPQANGPSGKYVLTYSGSDAVGNTGKTYTQVIFVDAEPPRTHLKLDGPVYRDRYSTFAVSRTLIELSAIDDHSGVKAIYYRVDGSPAKEYRGPFSVQAGGKHTLTYYAVDMVNNSEKPLQMAFQIDNEPPALHINYNVEPLKDSGDGVPVYPRNLVIGFNAVDSQTEVDKIIYRFNNEKELLYRNLVSDFEPGKVYRLTVYALDRLGNKREQSVVFRVE